MVTKVAHAICIGSSTAAHDWLHLPVGIPATHSVLELQQAAVIMSLYARNSMPVPHGVAGHSAAAVSITSFSPIMVTMLAQSRCIGSRTVAHAVVHVVGRPETQGWAPSSQHAALMAAVRARNSCPVHDAPPVLGGGGDGTWRGGGGGHRSQDPPQSTPVSSPFDTPSVHDEQKSCAEPIWRFMSFAQHIWGS